MIPKMMMSDSQAPICECGNAMVLRKRKTDGKPFYGCAKFGKGGCTETANTSDADYA